MSGKYLTDFLRLKCAGDIINAVSPVNNFEKEISEAMAIRHNLRKIVLAKPMEYTVLDLCAGNALAGIISVFTLPIQYCHAFDIKPREREGFKTVKKWSYTKEDIHAFRPEFIEKRIILIASHACRDLAVKIIELYNQSKASALIMIPCCTMPDKSKQETAELLKQKGLSHYDRWCLWLYNQCLGKKRLFQDTNILSQCNNILVSTKQKLYDEIVKEFIK
jgi:hypothetical protein